MVFLKDLALAAVMLGALAGCAAVNSQTALPDLKQLAQNHALVVVYADGTVKTYDDNGIKPLFKHLDACGNFKDSYIYDKVTGKASTLILAYGGAAHLYTGVLSKEAIPILEKHGINYSADTLVDYIVNREGNDKCPIEKTVAGIEDPKAAYEILKDKFGM